MKRLTLAVVITLVVTISSILGLYQLATAPPPTGIPLRALLAPPDLPPWVSLERADPSVTHWEIVASWYVPPEQVGGGPANVYALVVDAANQPTLRYRAVALDGGMAFLPPKLNDAGQAEANFNMTADSSFDPARGERGPYSIAVEGYPSDTAKGLGLPLRRHVQYWFVFRLTAGAAPGVTPTPAIGPTPTPTTSVTLEQVLARMARALRLAAEDLERAQ